MSVSNLEYIGAPKPTGTPDALNSIIAPHDEPAFLTAKRYFSPVSYTHLTLPTITEV